MSSSIKSVLFIRTGPSNDTARRPWQVVEQVGIRASYLVAKPVQESTRTRSRDVCSMSFAAVAVWWPDHHSPVVTMCQKPRIGQAQEPLCSLSLIRHLILFDTKYLLGADQLLPNPNKHLRHLRNRPVLDAHLLEVRRALAL